MDAVPEEARRRRYIPPKLEFQKVNYLGHSTMSLSRNLAYATMTTLALGTLAGCSNQKQLAYPAAPSDNTVDTIFGMTVPDPYRPLENDTAAETLRWVEAENKVTEDYLSKIPFRSKINSRLTELNNYVKRGMTYRFLDRFHFPKLSEMRNPI